MSLINGDKKNAASHTLLWLVLVGGGGFTAYNDPCSGMREELHTFQLEQYDAAINWLTYQGEEGTLNPMDTVRLRQYEAKREELLLKMGREPRSLY